jgi:hypothetical protein
MRTAARRYLRLDARTVINVLPEAVAATVQAAE